MNAVIVTARAGSKSIRDKNTFMVRGKPLVGYPIQAGKNACRCFQDFCFDGWRKYRRHRARLRV